MRSFGQRLLSILGLGKEQKRVDSEWDQAVKRLVDSTDQIRKQRENMSLLQDTKDKLIEHHNHIRHVIYGSLEPIDGSGQAENS